jgi:hypothetical protein
MYSTRGLLLLALASVASLQTIQVPPSVVCVLFEFVRECVRAVECKRRPQCIIKRDLPAARRSVCGNKRASTEGVHSDAVC